MYDPTNDPLLSAEAAALPPGALAAHARLAEALLGVDGARYDALAPAVQRLWAEMVTLQISYQAARGADAEAMAQSTAAGTQRVWRGGALPVSPAAAALRDYYFDGGFRVGGIEPPEVLP